MSPPLMQSAALASMLAGLLLPGCANGPVGGNPPVVARCGAPSGGDRPGPALVGQQYGMTMTPIPLNSVQFGSEDAARSMAVQSLFAARTATGAVEVSARFVSCLDTPATAFVRTSFLRANTAPAEPASAWRSVYLQPRATAVYSELSLSLDAATYLIEVTK